MYRYSDYFPRTMLLKCGVSPDAELSVKDKESYSGDGRYENIGKDMRSLFYGMTRALEEKKLAESERNELSIGIGRRIIAAFYDVGILTEGDRVRYPLDARWVFNREEREKISVVELSESSQAVTNRLSDLRSNGRSAEKGGRDEDNLRFTK